MYPLNQSKKFYNNFRRYIIKKDKDLKIFKLVLNEDIETYLFVINNNKEQLFTNQKYDKLKIDPIRMNASLKLVKYNIDQTKKIPNDGDTKEIDNSGNKSENLGGRNTKEIDICNAIGNECDIIVELIEDIKEFSKNEKTLAIYIKSTIWANLIKEYNSPDWENISNCHKLRELYKKYNELINCLYKNYT